MQGRTALRRASKMGGWRYNRPEAGIHTGIPADGVQRRTMVRRLLAVGILFLGVCFTASAGVLTFNFAGNFTFDNDVQLFTVTLAVPEVLTAWTTSGATGGFPTDLAMFEGDGTGM